MTSRPTDSPAPAADRLTVGVAIAVPEPWAGQLRSCRAEFGDRQADTIPTHITLLPPTPVAAGQLPQVERHLAATAAGFAPFEMQLRGTGTFRPVSPVVFVAVAAGISECELLAEAVGSGPLAAIRQFPYHPHVTVAHDVDDRSLDRAFETLADFTCAFWVEEFGLYVHDDVHGWHARREFGLGTTGSDA